MLPLSHGDYALTPAAIPVYRDKWGKDMSQTKEIDRAELHKTIWRIACWPFT